jgi:predicted metal-dependent phosphoesterase TrpH
MLFDFHVHTRISPCSDLDLKEILKHARSRGLNGVCITDHDTMDIRNFCQEGIQRDGLCIIFGMEYSTAEGDFLIFGPFEGVPRGLSAKEILTEVDKSGGVAIAAHPCRKARPTMEYVIKEGYCSIVEGINGRNQRHENQMAMSLYQNYPVSFLGGSDSHTLEELGSISTLIYGEIRTRSDLINAVKQGNFYLDTRNHINSLQLTESLRFGQNYNYLQKSLY